MFFASAPQTMSSSDTSNTAASGKSRG
jgi:hypothetical protein